MASKDLLENLFDVERKAEALVSEAREEAGRRVDAAKVRAQKYYSEAYDAALAKAIAAKEGAERAVRADYDAAVEDFRVKLEATRLDATAFAAACESAIAKVP